MSELFLSSIERIYYRPSDKAQKLILKLLKQKRESNPRLSMNALVDEIVISHLGIEYNYQTISTAIRNTPEWKAWLKHQEEAQEFDAWETNDTGWMSDEHARAFIKFVRDETRNPQSPQEK